MNRFNTELPRVELPEPPKNSWFTKYHLWGYAFLALTFLLIVGFIYQMEYGRKPQESRICIQVVTMARNPYTGETGEFPTPCDVPEKWEIVPGVYNEIPDFKIDNNTTNVESEFNKGITGGYSDDVYGFELQFPNENSYFVENFDAGGHSLINFSEFVNPDGAMRFSVELISYLSNPDLELKDFKYKDSLPVDSSTLSGQKANIYVQEPEACEQNNCPETYIAYAAKFNDVFYVISFKDVGELTQKEKSVLNSFKFR